MVKVKVEANIIMEDGTKKFIVLDYSNLEDAIADLKENLIPGDVATVYTLDGNFKVIKLEDKLYKCDEVCV